MKNYLKEQKKQQHTNLKQVIIGSNLQLYRKKKTGVARYRKNVSLGEGGLFGLP
jgi:hypothetical protein